MKIKHVAILVLLTLLSTVPVANADSTTRIVGGTVAPEGAYPFIAALVTKDEEPYGGQFCGGTLIDPNWVLTAAHCVVTDEGAPMSPSALDVILGIHDLANDTAYDKIAISQIIVHPSYDSVTVDSDIALLKLESPANSKYTPATLVKDGTDYVGQMLTVMGWGLLKDGGEFPDDVPQKLMEVSVPEISNEACAETNGDITDNMLCAGYAEGQKDSCSGDSGGPLVIQENGVWTLVGVVSYGDGCAKPNSYGVYTRVTKFLTFIKDNAGVQAGPGATDPGTTNPGPTEPGTTDTPASDYDMGYNAAVEACKADPASCGITVSGGVVPGAQADGTWVIVFPDPKTVTDDNFWEKVNPGIEIFNAWSAARFE